MQEKTKQYLGELINTIEIQINSIDMLVYDVQKTKSKLKKFYARVVRNVK